MESMVLEPESIKDLVEITGSCHQKLRWSRSLTEFLSQTSNGQGNKVFISHNQQKLKETAHLTHSEYYRVRYTGGREYITTAEGETH